MQAKSRQISKSYDVVELEHGEGGDEIFERCFNILLTSLAS